MAKSILVAIVAFACTALVGIGRSVEATADWAFTRFERTFRWLVKASPLRPALALEGLGGVLDPQPGLEQSISDQLYQRNRHEAYSHARAAHRRV